ncbi:MAG: hypothetical protein K8R17_03745 [Methanosarcinales archaeon]|nr:hypothetical protein [Methanosarcinales archaeon]
MGWLRMLFSVTEGGLMLSCQKLGLHPTRFRINELKGRRTGRRGITEKEIQTNAV